MIELKRTLFALASEAEIQKSIYPDFVCVGDELVLDFDQAYSSTDLLSLTSKGIDSLKVLDEYLATHSGEKYADHYLYNDRLESSELWVDIRNLAQQSIIANGWSYEVPEKSNAIYIQGPET